MSAKTVLVIDDDPMARQIADLALSQGGYGVVTAKDGETGLGLAGRIRADLILLDLHMPDISGHQVLRALRRHAHLRVPVLIMSRSNDAQTIRAALQDGANGYLVKPLNAAKLLRRVEALTRSQPQPKPQVASET